jgi:hypothetical protein
MLLRLGKKKKHRRKVEAGSWAHVMLTLERNFTVGATSGYLCSSVFANTVGPTKARCGYSCPTRGKEEKRERV